VGEEAIGGIMGMPESVPEGTPPHWTTYVTVKDIEDVAEKVKSYGGKLLVPPTEIPGVGRFCTFADPQGARISAITYFPQE
jgi:predicted enzyme related to lactoylglutathione lyase